MKNLILTFILATVASSSYADTCSDISGVYFLDSGSVTQQQSINSAALVSGSCQYVGSGSTPSLLPGELRLSSINKTNYPNGIRIYVYAISQDNCKYRSFVSIPANGTPRLDTIAYNDFRSVMPSEDDIAWGRVSVGDGIYWGGIDISGLKTNSDGNLSKEFAGYSNQPSSDNGSPFGIQITSTYTASAKILPNENIETSASLRSKGFKFKVVPVNRIDATTCLFEKRQ